MMQVLLFSQDQSALEIIRRAFEAQGVRCTPLMYPYFGTFQIFQEHQGVIFHLKYYDAQDAVFLASIRNAFSKMAFVILLEHIHHDFFAKTKMPSHTLVYEKPFPFSRVGLDLKFLLYSLRETSPKKELCVSDVALDLESRKAFRKGKLLILRNKEFSLLEFLMRNIGKVLTRNELLEHVWDQNATMLTNTVDVHMSKLRRKIDKGRRRPLIHTVYCVGYTFGDTK